MPESPTPEDRWCSSREKDGHPKICNVCADHGFDTCYAPTNTPEDRTTHAVKLQGDNYFCVCGWGGIDGFDALLHLKLTSKQRSAT